MFAIPSSFMQFQSIVNISITDNNTCLLQETSCMLSVLWLVISGVMLDLS